MKFALLSVTYSGLFYAGKALSLEQQIHKARELGFDALSIETKRPIASPLDLSKDDRTRLKSVSADMGIPICAIESLSDFSGRHMEDRENNLAMMRLVLDLAHDLGVDLVKVFASWPGIINDEENVSVYAQYDRFPYYKQLYPEDLRKWNRAVSGIREIADRASDMGITLALQNHAPVVRAGYEDVLAMMEEINRENVKLCLDVPLYGDRQTDQYVKESVEKCGEHVVLTHFGAWNFFQKPDGKIVQGPSPSFDGPINYKTFFKGLEQVGYDGYLVGEYCLPVIRNHQLAGIEEVDKAMGLALTYVKDQIKSSRSKLAAGL
jgi:sugar phosphate isomerase/epimerase